MLEQQIVSMIGDYKLREDEPIRRAKRPADGKILVEVTTQPGGTSEYKGLSDFYLCALLTFVEDTGSDRIWFEGLAYQSLFHRLGREDFLLSYEAILQKLTLPPPGVIELQKSYRSLSGRVDAFCGVTSDGDYWAGIFGPSYFD